MRSFDYKTGNHTGGSFTFSSHIFRFFFVLVAFQIWRLTVNLHLLWQQVANFSFRHIGRRWLTSACRWYRMSGIMEKLCWRLIVGHVTGKLYFIEQLKRNERRKKKTLNGRIYAEHYYTVIHDRRPITYTRLDKCDDFFFLFERKIRVSNIFALA